MCTSPKRGGAMPLRLEESSGETRGAMERIYIQVQTWVWRPTLHPVRKPALQRYNSSEGDATGGLKMSAAHQSPSKCCGIGRTFPSKIDRHVRHALFEPVVSEFAPG